MRLRRCYAEGTEAKRPMTNINPTAVQGIYTCLEILRLESEELHAWWCNLLYCHDGEPNYRVWDEHHLAILENDLIYNISLAQ